ncbi:MAG: hypothetical protein AB1641_29870 [Thermodesulfobacteriota bacterium]
MTRFTLVDLTLLEPSLKELLDDASVLSRNRIDEAEAWATLKPALTRLVGWDRIDDGDPVLFSPEAYDLVAHEVLARLAPAPAEEGHDPDHRH